jgi:hypothetical protein
VGSLLVGGFIVRGLLHLEDNINSGSYLPDAPDDIGIT